MPPTVIFYPSCSLLYNYDDRRDRVSCLRITQKVSWTDFNGIFWINTSRDQTARGSMTTVHETKTQFNSFDGRPPDLLTSSATSRSDPLVCSCKLSDPTDPRVGSSTVQLCSGEEDARLTFESDSGRNPDHAVVRRSRVLAASRRYAPVYFCK